MKPATHEDFSRADHSAQGGSDRSFGFVFAAFFAIVALWPLKHGLPMRSWAFVPSGVFLIAALVLPGILQPLNRIWTKFGLLLSKVMNPVILAILFYGVFVPYGFLARVFGKKLLRLRAEGQSYWVLRTPPGPPADTLRNQF